jgi:hypothetical protein
MEENSAQPSQPTVPNIPSPEEVVKEAKKGNFNKSIILVVVLVILTVILLVVSLNIKKGSPAPYVTKQVQTNVAQSSLSISDSPRIASTSGAYETDVNIDSGTNKVTGIQLSISYDPKVLTNVDIKPGTFLPDGTVISKQVDAQKGTITFLLGTSQGKKGVSGTGQVAVISFTKVIPDDTNLSFLPDTLVSAEGYDQSVLSKTSSAVIGALPTQ